MKGNGPAQEGAIESGTEKGLVDVRPVFRRGTPEDVAMAVSGKRDVGIVVELKTIEAP
jgi:hypothetical protein